ncbi:MAG: putative anaerobic dimethyl sulfoxide reductase, chain reductase precursor [Holophagaceae bacterium]|nr:putative anaerobic dimethyl sulfoxide reductase, chain reductase precursor [Holophagaceae bacterium]
MAQNTPSKPFTMEQAKRIAARKGEEVVPTFCAMCGPGPFACGIYAFVKDGRFVRVAGMAESPVNRGALCPKAHAAPQWVYSPDRLQYPLKRVGEKGEGKFERISWDEAIQIIADTLKRQKAAYGPESLAILSPALRTYSDYLRRFLTVHGSPNYGHSGICAMQRAFAFMYTLGDWPGPDLGKSDLIIYWGRQPIYSGPATPGPKMLVGAKARGAKIIAIKPSVEPDSGMADIWVPLRPGTDAALALAMLHVVVEEKLIDEAFVEKWCYGYEQLKSHVRQYPPEWAEPITGVSAQQIREVARLYATTPRASIDLGNGVEHAPSSNDAIRAVAILIAITGHLDRPGGNLFGGPFGVPSTMPTPKDITLRERFTQEMVEKLVGPEFPRPFQPFAEGLSSAYYRIFDSILTEKPYPIRTVIAPGTQPSVSTRGSQNVIEALKKLEFYVVVDVTRTADMAYADIVLPTTTPYESDHPFDGRGGWLMARNKVIEPLGDYKSIYEFFLELGVAMGYGADFWHGDMTEAMNDQLQPFGMNIDGLREHPVGLTYPPLPRTYENYERCFQRRSPRLTGAPFLPQGKVAIYNTSFEAEGFSPMPEWREPPESLTATPALADRFPLILSDYHTSKNYTASWQRNVPLLRELEPHPLLHIHPDTAGARGITQGDWVIVESPHASIRVKAELYPGIRPDTVMVLHGWWQGCKELGLADTPLLAGGANVNTMYSVEEGKAYDPLVTAMTSQTLVEVRRA